MESFKNNTTDDYNYEGYHYEEELISMCDMENFNRIRGVSFIIICCLSTLGNGLLIYILVRFKDIKKVTMLYLFFLALFDLLFTLTLPFWAVDHLHHWIFTDGACKFLTGTYFVAIYGSLILLTAMTVDRFFAIVVRSQSVTRRHRLIGAKVTCVTAFVIGTAACIKDASSSTVIHINNVNMCISGWPKEESAGYYTQLALLFLLPLAIIIFCYGKIVHTIMSTSYKQKYRTVMVVLCIVVAFFVCWGPYHVFMIINSVHQGASCLTKKRIGLAFVIFQIFAYSHCCVNPLLYMLTGRSRKILSSLLLCSPELTPTAIEGRATDQSQSNIGLHSLVFRAKEQDLTELKTI